MFVYEFWGSANFAALAGSRIVLLSDLHIAELNAVPVEMLEYIIICCWRTSIFVIFV